MSFERFNNAVGIAGDRMAAFAEASARATSSVSGLVDSFRGLSRTTAGIGSVLTAFGGHIGKIIGIPLGIAGAAGAFAGGVMGAGLNLAAAAAPNGLQSVDKAFNILAGTIGSIVLPGVVILGGVALAAAGFIAQWVQAHKVQIINFWVDAVQSATTAVKKFTWALEHPGEAMAEGSLAVNKALGIPGPETTDPVGDRVKELFAQARAARGVAGGGFGMQGGGGPPVAAGNQRIGEGGVGGIGQQGFVNGAVGAAPPPAANKFLGDVATGMMQIIKDMRQSMGMTGITDPVAKWKEVAMQVQKSDLDRQNIANQEKSLQFLQQIAVGIQQMANGGGLAVAGP